MRLTLCPTSLLPRSTSRDHGNRYAGDGPDGCAGALVMAVAATAAVAALASATADGNCRDRQGAQEGRIMTCVAFARSAAIGAGDGDCAGGASWCRGAGRRRRSGRARGGRRGGRRRRKRLTTTTPPITAAQAKCLRLVARQDSQLRAAKRRGGNARTHARCARRMRRHPRAAKTGELPNRALWLSAFRPTKQRAMTPHEERTHQSITTRTIFFKRPGSLGC